MATKTTRTYKNKDSGLMALPCKLSKNLLVLADFLSPFAPLILRFWVAVIFWKSGLTKIINWDGTLFLFRDVHPIPYLPVEMAAYMGTTAELVLPVLLFLGLGTRFAAVGLLIMTFVIQYTFESNREHAVWAVMLLPIILSGPGNFSWDFFIRYNFCEKMPDHISTLSQNLALIMVVALTIFVSHEVLTVVIESWNTPWLTEMRTLWDGLDSWLGSPFRDG